MKTKELLEKAEGGLHMISIPHAVKEGWDLSILTSIVAGITWTTLLLMVIGTIV